jgi:hypothetical protein
MLNPILEASIDENKGICDDVQLDINQDGRYEVIAGDLITEYSVRVQEYGSRTAGQELNPNGTIGTSRDYDQWGNMILDFRSCWDDTKGLVRRPECGP